MEQAMLRSAGGAAAFVIALTGHAWAQLPSKGDAYEIARDAYLYAYPIVAMDVFLRQATNVPDVKTAPLRAPIDQFAHARAYPSAEDKEVVRENFDTLFSGAWLDVAREPIVLSVPDTRGRYYLLAMLDMWTDVFSVVGSRTTGSQAGNYALVAPGWSGTLPEGVTKIVAPTPAMWILGRTQANGPADYDDVHKIQDGYKLTPLSQWGKDYTPPTNAPTDPTIDSRTPPLVQVNHMGGVEMLARLAELMAKYPPHGDDYPILFRMRQIGLEPGKPFDASKLDPRLVETINAAAKDAFTDLEKAGKSGEGLTKANGWFYAVQKVGTYGTDYKRRALATYAGLGVKLPEDAVYAASFVDGDGKPYSGANGYVLRFERDKLPPADALWSVTLYDDQGFQTPNPINRFAIGDRDKLAFNADGSLDLYIQGEPPDADKETNWLPAPSGAFNLAMRIYSPRREMLDGSWTPPPVMRTDKLIPSARARFSGGSRIDRPRKTRPPLLSWHTGR
jgi:hypothetical protein